MHQQIAGSDAATISLSLTKNDLVIDYRAPDLGRGQAKVFVALGTGRAIGSAVIPFAQNLEGSTVFLPFKADLFFMVDYGSEADVCSTRLWQEWKWSNPTIKSDVKVRGARKVILRIPRIHLGEKAKLKLAVYAKDVSENNGWGRFFGCIDPSVIAGHGDKYIPHYYEVDLQSTRAPFATACGRLGTKQGKIRIYQLFLRLFSNTNETRKPNGSLAENGAGKFNQINDAALSALQQMGFSHIWLTGLLRHATGTDYPEIGAPADDPDLLKGVAGSPFAIKDYFDICPDYALNPAARMDELKALLARLRQHKLKAIIDFIPNHVARCYDCEANAQFNFGLRDDRSTFFAPQNNYFYLQPNGDGPPLQLPTWKNGQPISATCQLPGMKCDGRFGGELDHGRATGNNVASWKPHLHDWYETVKLNYGFDFTHPDAQTREYPNAASPNKAIPDTWEKMDQVIAHWQTIGIDGFRCDMSHMQPPEFWNWLIHRARERQADTVFIGEAYNNDPAKVPGSDPVLSQLSYGRGNVMFDLLDAGFNAVYDDPTYRAIKKIYEGPGWANDIDAVGHDAFIFDNSLRYAENHDEVRLAAPGHWGGIGMNVGRAASTILFGLSRGPLLLYNGQEVGEPAVGAEGFGGDDARTSIFDYWSMPELVRWVNHHQYDGSRLSAEQKALRAFYSQLVNLTAEPAFHDGEFYPLNCENRDNPSFGRIGDETVSGHWCYSFLRFERTSSQRFLVLVNLHPELTLREVRVIIPPAGVEFLGLTEAEPHLRFTDRLAFPSPGRVGVPPAVSGVSPDTSPQSPSREKGITTLTTACTLEEISSIGLPIPEIAPLSACYLECSTNT